MFGLKLIIGEIVVDLGNCFKKFSQDEYKNALNNIAYLNEFDFDGLDIWTEDILEVYNKEELIKALGGSTIRFRLVEEADIEIYYTEFDSLAEAITAFEYANGRLTNVDRLNGRKNSVEVYEIIGDEEFVLNVVK